MDAEMKTCPPITQIFHLLALFRDSVVKKCRMTLNCENVQRSLAHTESLFSTLKTWCLSRLRMLSPGSEWQKDKTVKPVLHNTYPASDAGLWARTRVEASPPGSRHPCASSYDIAVYTEGTGTGNAYILHLLWLRYGVMALEQHGRVADTVAAWRFSAEISHNA